MRRRLRNLDVDLLRWVRIQPVQKTAFPDSENYQRNNNDERESPDRIACRAVTALDGNDFSFYYSCHKTVNLVFSCT